MKKLQNIGRIGRFFTSGETLLGPNALAGLARLTVNRAVVVVSPSVWSRHQKYISKCLSRLSIEVLEAPKGEPTSKNALQLARQFKNFSPDIVIAIGGGSVIDVAKLAWVLFEKPEMQLETNRVIFPVSNLRSKTTGFVAVPTTYGSGSENSSAAVFQHGEGKQKNFLVGPELLPDIAVLDPALAMGLPVSVAAFGIMDTLAHAIEGYVSKASNEAIRQLAIGSLGPLRAQLRAKPLPELIDDQVAVNKFMTSAAFAGAVQNIANPGLAHSLSHYCAMFGVNHGQGCGYFLPLSIRYNKQDDTVSAAYNRLAQEMGFADQTDLLSWLDELVAEFGLAKGIPSVASLKDQIDHEIFFADPTINTNPVPINLETVFELMEAPNAV